MDNFGGNERNFDRLAVEYYSLFSKGYSSRDRETEYSKLPDNKKMFFYGFGVLCEWSVSASRKYDQLLFKEKQVSNVKYPTFDPTRDGSSIPTCDVDTEEYPVGIQDFLAVRFAAENFLADKKDELVVIPASVYYILVKSYWNDQNLSTVEGIWTALGILTPLDEFYLFGKALQYSSKGLRVLRLSKVRTLAKGQKIDVPLDAKGTALKNQSTGKLDDYVEWRLQGAGNLWDDIILKGNKGVVEALSSQYKNIDEFLAGAEYASKVSSDFVKYQARGGALDLTKYTTKHKVITGNRMRGEISESVFQDLEKGFKPEFSIPTSDGPRFVDNLLGNTARELKSGKISLTDAFKRQVRKDLEIIKAQGDLVDKVEWHALNGIENDALKFVRDEMTLKGVSASDFKVVVY